MIKAANDNMITWPRGLNRVRAAMYIGVPLVVFDKMVIDGSMPPPKRFYQRTIWDRAAIDRSFDLLDGGNATTISGEEIVEFAA